MNDLPPLQIAAASDTGRSRSENQDFAYAGPLPGAEDWQLLAVADGVGGHARGEWASQRAIEVLAASLGDLLGQFGPAEALERAATMANTTVNREAASIGAPGAATTLVAALVRGYEAWWLNIGDSRIYRFSAAGLEQVSADHSWVAEQVRSGQLSAEDARHHGRRNVVTRTVGFDASVSPDGGGPITLEEGDALLLCSDGLHGPVDDARIAATIAELDPQFAVSRLVELANEAGGPDNITAVIARRGATPAAPAATNVVDTVEREEPQTRRSRKRFVLALALGTVVVGSAVAAVAYFLL